MIQTTNKAPAFSWAVPKELGIPADPLRLRLDFHHQVAVMTYFQGDVVTTKQVDAMDVAHALASGLSFGSGLLPPDTLWWQNTRGGPVYALYVEPKIWKLALQEDIKKAPQRFNIPLPRLIFLCMPGQAPWVYAVEKATNQRGGYCLPGAAGQYILITAAPAPEAINILPGISEVVQSFFISFFSATAELIQPVEEIPQERTATLEVPGWEKEVFPNDDLIEHGTISDLMTMEM